MVSYNKFQSAKGPTRSVRTSRESKLPFLLRWPHESNFVSPGVYLCCRCSNTCAHSSFLLAWFNFHPKMYHLVVLPNVWSYLTICFPTQFPGPYFSILHSISCFGISLFISDLSGFDLCSSDIWILATSLSDVPG